MPAPPGERVGLMTEPTWVSEDTGSVPSHEGEQPPPLARMNAMSNAFCPVADITWLTFGALLSSVYRYGADSYQLTERAAAASAGAPWVSTAMPPANAPAASRAAAAMAATGRERPGRRPCSR